MNRSRASKFRSRNQVNREDEVEEQNDNAAIARSMVGLDTTKVKNLRALYPSSSRDELKQDAKEQDYDASLSAAMVAANLISSARFILKQDIVFTKYSAQYLVDNACPKKENRQGEETKDHDCSNFELTVKDALKFALKNGIPKKEDWLHLGCRFKRPSLPCYTPPLVSLKGKVIEPKRLEEVYKYLADQPIGARLHVFSDLDTLGDVRNCFFSLYDDKDFEYLNALGSIVFQGIYRGGRTYEASYVGLRDVLIFEIEQDEKTTTATVKICYKKKESFIKVSMNAMFMLYGSRGMSPSSLLVDYCLPRLSK